MITIKFAATTTTIPARDYAEFTNDLDRRGIDWTIER